MPHGQEIYLFFFRYGVYGIFGIILCSAIMSYIIYKALNIILKNNINNYKDFFKVICKKNSKKRYLNSYFIINFIINVFLFFSFSIMVAGFGAFLTQKFRN